MNIYKNLLYQEDLQYIANLKLPWDKLCNSSILISGATGMVGRTLIDAIMKRNQEFNMGCKVYAVGRNEEKAKLRFSEFWSSDFFNYIKSDINKNIADINIDQVDYIIHLASNTHPVAYSIDPIGTVLTNVIGINNLLDFAVHRNVKRVVFVSSNEIYGENRGDKELFDENYCGYINSNTLRAGYPESKRCGEALCQAYIKQKSVDIVIPRLTRTFGPTMLMDDSKASSQFIKKGLSKSNIVLKSQGTQCFSYTYVVDAVAGLLTVLLKGKCGEAYNVADSTGDIMLKNLAQLIAEYANTDVVFELPNEVEKAGYSTATKARLDGDKLHQLGWSSKYTIKDGVYRTLSIMESCCKD